MERHVTKLNPLPSARVIRLSAWKLFTDTQPGIKREVFSIPRLAVSRFSFDTELLVAATRFGYQITAIPVSVAYNRAGHSGRIGLTHMIGLLIDTLRIFY